MSSDPHQRTYSYLLRAQELISDMALSDQSATERGLFEAVEEAVRCAKTMGWGAGVIEDDPLEAYLEEEEEIPVLGPSDDPKGDLEKMFGPLDEDRKLESPFTLFYVVPSEGHLKSTLISSWKDILTAWRYFREGKWSGPAGLNLEMELITLLMNQIGMFED